MVVDPLKKNNLVDSIVGLFSSIFYDLRKDETPKKLSKKVRKRKNEKRN